MNEYFKEQNRGANYNPKGAIVTERWGSEHENNLVQQQSGVVLVAHPDKKAHANSKVLYANIREEQDQMKSAVQSEALASQIEVDKTTGQVRVVTNTSDSKSSIRTRTPTPGLVAHEDTGIQSLTKEERARDVIKSVESVIGYTDLHPTVRARINVIYERLDLQDGLIKDLQYVLSEIKGMDWAAIQNKLDRDVEMMQGTCETVKTMTEDFYLDISKMKKENSEVLSIIKKEVTTVKVSFEDYTNKIQNEFREDTSNMAKMVQVISESLVSSDTYQPNGLQIAPRDSSMDRISRKTTLNLRGRKS